MSFQVTVTNNLFEDRNLNVIHKSGSVTVGNITLYAKRHCPPHPLIFAKTFDLNSHDEYLIIQFEDQTISYSYHRIFLPREAFFRFLPGSISGASLSPPPTTIGPRILIPEQIPDWKFIVKAPPTDMSIPGINQSLTGNDNVTVSDDGGDI